MKVLVTGAAGFIGRHLVDRLLRESCEVRTFVLPGSAPDWSADAGVQTIEGDVRDYNSVRSAAAGVDLIYHLAALTQPDRLHPNTLYDVNVGGTRNIARAALEHSVDRLVHVSSAAVYGRRIRKHGINEETPKRPDSPYSKSKLQAEQLLLSYQEKDGLPIVIARTSNVFGPGAQDWREFFQLIAAGRFRFIGKGHGLMQVTSVEDMTQGLWLCGTRAGVEGNSYIITGGQSISLCEWIELIRAETGGSIQEPAIPAAPLHIYNMLDSIVYAAFRRELPRADRLNLFLSDRSFDISRAATDLDYHPRSSARDVVRQTVKWYRSQGYLDLEA
jgi:nucleoside-diphosphate-sugar epimerase